jgi:hypothetical protein
MCRRRDVQSSEPTEGNPNGRFACLPQAGAKQARNLSSDLLFGFYLQHPPQELPPFLGVQSTEERAYLTSLRARRWPPDLKSQEAGVANLSKSKTRNDLELCGVCKIM